MEDEGGGGEVALDPERGDVKLEEKHGVLG